MLGKYEKRVERIIVLLFYCSNKSRKNYCSIVQIRVEKNHCSIVQMRVEKNYCLQDRATYCSNERVEKNYCLIGFHLRATYYLNERVEKIIV